MDFLGILTTSITSAIGPVAAIYALAIIGLNMHFGYTGLLNFGQVGFMLVGAYGVAVCVGTFGLPLSVGVAASILCAVVLALLMGIPTLRLRADYLAICTIAVAEGLRFVYRAPFARDLTGGVFGRQNLSDGFRELNPFPPGRYGVGDITFSSPHLWTMVVTWSLVLVSCLIMWSLMHSPWGRVIKGIREDEDAVRSLGKNVFVYKLQSLVIGGVFGALAGVMIALHQASVTPDQFRPQVTFYLWAMLLLGGAGRTWGPVIGSVVMWFLLTFTDETMRALDQMGWLPFVTGGELGAVRHALVGLILVLLIIYRPQGLIGNRREMLVNVK
ncbi:branched-chain amino acid ABC transporter permease [Lipingzhangella sp. LS1_29]|uniref:Branched-chain amino acid ABC transporter permease n=1 Tax=Lipingzhangella rawalii TaxID=2055835 RepID=A0ABU2H211_9ACTN|nr:branched-chain amino acid ABC transporter permease [Lipingzhangella rawalii]MDS1269332.1 branched-chain amino acid ABC transporter permease [Lipingzhangella rawalii]